MKHFTLGLALAAVAVLLYASPVAANTILFPGGGGTGSSTLTGILKGNGTSPVQTALPGTDYQAPLTLTTTGSSGAATLTGATLNIPQYTGGGSTGLSTSTPWNVLQLAQVASNGSVSSIATSSLRLTTSSFNSTNVSQWTNDAGYLTANQNITLTGDITGSGATSIATTYSNVVPANKGGAGTISGLLKANGSGLVSAAANGTDYTLLTATTCSAGQHVSALTAAGGVTCSADSGASYAFTYPLVNSANTISLAFGTTTANSWSALQQFNGNASTTALTDTGNLWLPTLGAPAGSFLAVDPNGMLIATTTPSSGGYNPIGTTGQFPYFSATNTLSATSSLFLASSGNIGIATTAPSEALAVQGNVNISGVYKINGTQIIYLPNQTPFSGTLYIGAGGTSLSHSSGNQGQGNIAVGLTALTANTTGSNNAAIGPGALTANTTGANNVAIGYTALTANTTGSANTAIGYNAMPTATSSSLNVAIGPNALFSLNGGIGDNIAIGNQAAYFNTSGTSLLAIGNQALHSNTTASYNIGIGDHALYGMQTGQGNIGIGYWPLRYDTASGYNTAIGYLAGTYLSDGATAASSTSSVFIGASTSPSSTSDVNSIVIGYSAVGLGSNTVVLGNSSITKTALEGNVGIGTTSPYAALSLGGGNLVLGASSAGGTPGDLYLPKLGVPAGTILAVDATGKVIATTTPSGGGISTATYPLQISGSNISLAFGTTTANTWSGLQTFTNTGTTTFSGGIQAATAYFTGIVEHAGQALFDQLATFASGIDIAAGNYLNFGATTGSSGYGIRDNAGTIQIKNSGGSWAAPGGSVVTPYFASSTNSAYIVVPVVSGDTVQVQAGAYAAGCNTGIHEFTFKYSQATYGNATSSPDSTTTLWNPGNTDVCSGGTIFSYTATTTDTLTFEMENTNLMSGTRVMAQKIH